MEKKHSSGASHFSARRKVSYCKAHGVWAFLGRNCQYDLKLHRRFTETTNARTIHHFRFLGCWCRFGNEYERVWTSMKIKVFWCDIGSKLSQMGGTPSPHPYEPTLRNTRGRLFMQEPDCFLDLFLTRGGQWSCASRTITCIRDCELV